MFLSLDIFQRHVIPNEHIAMKEVDEIGDGSCKTDLSIPQNIPDCADGRKIQDFNCIEVCLFLRTFDEQHKGIALFSENNLPHKILHFECTSKLLLALIIEINKRIL